MITMAESKPVVLVFSQNGDKALRNDMMSEAMRQYPKADIFPRANLPVNGISQTEICEAVFLLEENFVNIGSYYRKRGAKVHIFKQRKEEEKLVPAPSVSLNEVKETVGAIETNIVDLKPQTPAAELPVKKGPSKNKANK